MSISKIHIPEGASLNGTTLKSRSRTLSTIEAQRISWLWPGRLAAGKINMLAGDPGDGKSTVALDAAARVTTGTKWPDGQENFAGDVILLSAEDDAADTIKPRFVAAGGDPGHCHIFDAVIRKESESFFSLADDIDALAELIEQTRARLVIIDPISAYLAGVDSHKNAELRSVLGPLAAMAGETGTCILSVSHLNKSNASAQYRVMGSLAFSAAARSTWVTAKDKENPSRRLLLPVKNNLASDTGGLAYTIQPSDHDQEIPVVAWEKEPVHITAEQALTPASAGNKTNDAADWLREVLDDGQVEVPQLKSLASDAGFSWRTIERAKQDMDIKSYRKGNPKYGGKFYWSFKSAKSPFTHLAELKNEEKTPF